MAELPFSAFSDAGLDLDVVEQAVSRFVLRVRNGQHVGQHTKDITRAELLILDASAELLRLARVGQKTEEEAARG